MKHVRQPPVPTAVAMLLSLTFALLTYKPYPLEIRNSCLSVEAKLNGQDVRLILANESPHTVLSPEAKKRLHITDLDRPVSIQVGDATLNTQLGHNEKDDRAFWNDIFDFQFEGEDNVRVDGILGTSELKRVTLGLDLLTREVKAWLNQPSPSEEKRWIRSRFTDPIHIASIPVEIKGDNLLLFPVVEGRPRLALLALGDRVSEFKSEKHKPSDAGIMNELFTDNRTGKPSRCSEWLDENVSLGDRTNTETNAVSNSLSFLPMIGWSQFAGCRLVIDLRRNRLLSASAYPKSNLLTRDLSTVGVELNAKGVITSSYAEANRKGVAVGDKIVVIGDAPVITKDGLPNIKAESDNFWSDYLDLLVFNQLTLVLKRNGKERTITLMPFCFRRDFNPCAELNSGPQNMPLKGFHWENLPLAGYCQIKN